MAERTDAREVRPVTTIGGIMPGGPEMTNWYAHIPFPDPAALAARRAKLLELIADADRRRLLRRAG